MNYGQSIYQLIFSTKHREPTLDVKYRRELFANIHATLVSYKSHVYRIGGVEDHLHIVSSLHPTMALSNLIKEIKLAASYYIKQNELMPYFCGWQEGYAYFTYSHDAVANLVEYVKGQEEHHQSISSEGELRQLLKEHHIDYDEKFFK